MSIIKSTDNFARKLGNLIPEWLIALTTRIALFCVFWNAVQSKLYGFYFLGQHWAFWSVKDSTINRFQYEYNVPLIPGPIAAYITTFTEFFFSIALLIGLFTRMSALALFILVLVIQIFVYPGAWQTHILWCAGLLYLLRHGADAISIDHIAR